MELKQYLGTVATQLVNELQPILQIKAVTDNSDLLGKYTEAALRNLVNRIVKPMRISSGAVIDHPIQNPLRQIDIIIWAPFPAPALFDVEGFGLVPKSSAFGVIEVKRSNYNGVEKKIEEFFFAVESKKIVSEPLAGMDDHGRLPGIVVICVIETGPSAKLKKLVEEKKVVAIFEKVNRTPKVRTKDVLTLVNFLHYVTWRYRIQGSREQYLQIATKKL